jgi:ribosomal protein L7/L12
MLDQESAINLAKQMLSKDQAMENVLSSLREGGLSKMKSINVIKESTEMSFEDAKNLVHHSETWKDVFQRDTELLEAFYDLLESGELFSE